MTVIRVSDAPEFETQGNHMTGLASPSRGAKELLVFRGRLDPGAASPPHTHDHEEVFVVTEGKVHARIGDEEHELSAGDAAVIPPNTVHQVVNKSDGAFDLVISMLAGTRFFRPDGEEVPAPPWTK
jgi:quercetin dioxygenase-like cupin family protein